MELFSQHLNHVKQPLQQPPHVTADQTQSDVIKAAQDYTGVFFAEYVNMMLDEVDVEDEDGTYEMFKGLHAKALGDKMALSPAGQNLTNTLIVAIQKLQDQMEKGAA